MRILRETQDRQGFELDVANVLWVQGLHEGFGRAIKRRVKVPGAV